MWARRHIVYAFVSIVIVGHFPSPAYQIVLYLNQDVRLVRKGKWRRAQNSCECHQTLFNAVGGVWARDYITTERNALQLENGEQLCEARQVVSELRAKESVNSGVKLTKPLSVSAPEFVSATLSRQPGQAIDTPRTAPALSSGTRWKLRAVPTPVTVLPAVHSSSATTVPTVLPILHSTPITSASTVLPPVSTLSLNTAALSPSAFKYPPGFKELRDRVSKFAGDGREDFEVWLTDFCEATGDCKWTDEVRAQWFSWFLTRSAKSTWQRTLSREEKDSWTSIVQSYKSHYGLHMDPAWHT